MLTANAQDHVQCSAPLLVFHTNASGFSAFPKDGAWYVDVGGRGELKRYLTDQGVQKIEKSGDPESGLNGAALREASTPLFKAFAKQLSDTGVIIARVGIYGSIGATHILRNGFLFKRAIEFEGRSAVETPPKTPWFS